MQTELLKVTGMTCGGCSSKVTTALKGVNGVSDVSVSLDAGEVAVKYDEKLTSTVQLKWAVRGAGYDVDPTDSTHGHQGSDGCCGGGGGAAKASAPAVNGHKESKGGCCA